MSIGWVEANVLALRNRENAAAGGAADARLRIGKVLRPSARTGGSASYYDCELLTDEFAAIVIGTNDDRPVHPYCYGCAAPSGTTLAAGTVVALAPCAFSASTASLLDATVFEEVSGAAYDIKRVASYWMILSGGGSGSGYIEGAIAD